jgi:hypothetical protein
MEQIQHIREFFPDIAVEVVVNTKAGEAPMDDVTE